LHLLNLAGVERRPLSVALVVDRPEDLAAALSPFADYKQLQNALAIELGRPVAVDACFVFQLESGFETKWYDFAVASPTQFARLARPDRVQVVATAVDKQGRRRRAGLLVVPVDSEITDPRQLKGRLIGFGTPDNAATHHGALRYLESQGFVPGDIARELLPIPGRLRQYADAADMLRALAAGDIEAGFIDDADYTLRVLGPPHERAVADLRVRVLGRSAAYPRRLILARAGIDHITLARVREFLLHVGERHPDAMESLPSSGYCLPDPADLAACRRLKPDGVFLSIQPKLAEDQAP
jgi:ABC-type phosphate/phosphonate transport system substrate-binding protein